MSELVEYGSCDQQPISDGLPGSGENDSFAFPLTALQSRIWSADSVNPGNRAFNGAFRLSLEGPLEPKILEETFNALIVRHEILRAVCRVIDGKPMLLIKPKLKVHLSTGDLRSLPPEQRELEIDRLCGEEAQRGFDLQTGPLLRVGLLRIDHEQYILLLTVHHIICDGWSISILMDEIATLYSAIHDGQFSPLPDLEIQFADYAVWQNEQVANSEFATQLSYWRRKLDNYTPFRISTDFTRPDGLSVNSAIVSEMLPREMTEALKRFSDVRGGTMFTTSLAACIVVLHGHTGATDISIGSPVAGRTRTDIENVVGLFLNHIVFRVQFANDPTFSELASIVGETAAEALSNQDIPLEEVIRTVLPNLRCDESCYGISFSCQREYGRATTHQFEFAGIRMSSMPSKSQGALYDLNFFLVERSSGWRLSVEYNTDLYREATAKKMLDTFRQVIDRVAANPECKISELLKENALDGAAEVIPEQKTAGAEAREAIPTVFHKFPASVAQRRFWLLSTVASGSPILNMPACVRISGALSTHLLEKSCQLLIDRHEILRTTLRREGDDLVQICASHYAFTLRISDLSGVATAERERQLTEMIHQEAERAFDLSQSVPFRIQLICLSKDEHVLIVTIHHAASDGWSQGVLQRELWTIYHALVDNKEPDLEPLSVQYSDFTIWQNEWLNSDEAAEQLNFWTQKLSPPLPVLDIPTDRPVVRLTAAQGAMEIAVLPEAICRSLKEFSRSENVTMFMLTLACFAVLLSPYSDEGDVVVGSPVAGRKPEIESLVGPFSNPIAIRLNITEKLTLREVLQQAHSVTTDALAYSDLPFMVLLEKLQTRARHGRNPLFQLYFTYQTAFVRTLEFSDLKISPIKNLTVGTSFEIQLAVIERENEIHVQLDYNSNLFDAASIRRLLTDYCDLLSTLATAPERTVADVTLNPFRGSRSVATADSGRGTYHPPRNANEARLVNIFERIFDQPTIGIHDDFFDLGGQSLTAARLLHEIEKEFNIRIDLSEVILAPTVEKLGLRLESGAAATESLVVPLHVAGPKVPLFCIHSGGGHVIAYRELVSCLDRGQPVFGVRAPELDGAQKSLTVEELAEKYIVEIRRIQSHGPYQLCGMSFGGLVAYEMAMRLIGQGEKVAVLALFDTGNPAYYANLSFLDWITFRSIYIVDRFRKYTRNMLSGAIGNVANDVYVFFRNRIRGLAWRGGQKVSKLLRREMPKPLRSNQDMFSAASSVYTPQPYAGELLLFRAEGRTAEYGIDVTLGWREVVGNNIRVICCPGSHTSMMDKPHVEELAKQLSNFLLEY
jgi:non-ribosomal peptide synthetase component F/thioesterase domain-containing protein/acyl carrier protein